MFKCDQSAIIFFSMALQRKVAEFLISGQKTRKCRFTFLACSTEYGSQKRFYFSLKPQRLVDVFKKSLLNCLTGQFLGKRLLLLLDICSFHTGKNIFPQRSNNIVPCILLNSTSQFQFPDAGRIVAVKFRYYL